MTPSLAEAVERLTIYTERSERGIHVGALHHYDAETFADAQDAFVADLRAVLSALQEPAGVGEEARCILALRAALEGGGE